MKAEVSGGTNRSPLWICHARVVGGSDPRLVLRRNGFRGVILDYLLGQEGRALHLASGAEIQAFSTIGVPGGIPYWRGPGCGIWEYATRHLGRGVWDQVRDHPGCALTRDQVEALLSNVVSQAFAGAIVVAAKELPLSSAAPFIQFDASSLGLWDFDLVTEEARPRMTANGGVIQVRVVPIDEWKPQPFGSHVADRRNDVADTPQNSAPAGLACPIAPTADVVAIYRTGAPGRDSSMHLIEAEMKRRSLANEMITTSMTKEAAALSDWIKRIHPHAPPATPKTISNGLGKQWRILRERSVPK